MTTLFIEHSWNLIKVDVLELVNNFLRSGKLDEWMNITNICLIPETERPTKMTEVRPVSLCNMGYKIILKVFFERLKTCVTKAGLGDLVGFCGGTFDLR